MLVSSCIRSVRTARWRGVSIEPAACKSRHGSLRRLWKLMSASSASLAWHATDVCSGVQPT
eukprot:2226572-Prymnesium_polylepis.1